MPTIPVQEETKDTLAALKPPGTTWDQLLRWMTETRSQAQWVDILRGRAEREGAIVRARRLRRDGARSVIRDPSEQKALAEVARRRWDLWEDTGRIEELGERRFRLNPQEGDEEGEEPDVRVRRLRGSP